jgi:arginyl-tRNA synthetase
MQKEIKKLLEKAILTQVEDGFVLPEIIVERTKDEQFGDYTTNVAMVLGKSLKKNPIEIAESLIRSLDFARDDKGVFSKIEAVKPGYINFYLAPQYFQEKIKEINEKENKFGDSNIGEGVKVNNEFISANPTGPMHLGNGRGGFFGDTIAKVLRKAGYEVTNEYYVNDAGEQLLKLGHSVLKDSDAVYAGEYIDELSKKFGSLKDIKEVGEKSAENILENIIKKTVAEKMQISFDEWISEKKDLVDKGYVEKAIELLKDKKLTFESEGALWLKTTNFGDDKDRVLVKSDGQKTYFASDCGYILYKMERGFEKLIEIWGADHHGYIGRFKAAAKALGLESEVKFVIVQLVRLVKDGKEVRMSKRAGNVVYINELIEAVGHDVTRFFFLMYSPDTHMNFDLGLAKEQSQKNPVFYVQYAHARICSILEKAETEKYKIQNSHLDLLVHEKEISLIRELDKFPELVAELAESCEVHKLAHYSLKLADKFHSFYAACQVIDETNPELTSARLALANAVRIVLSETLRLIGVSAPNKM